MSKARILAAAAALALLPVIAPAQERTEFRVAWSIYVGWMPWGYLEDSGIMDKWAEKYGIDVEIVQINDYVESINQYTAGAFDGVSATNMDTLSIPSGGGVDTTALIVGDFSNGNDAMILKGEGDLAALAGKPVNLVELCVSHYLLARGLDSVGLTEADLAGVVNTSDADMIAAFDTDDVEAVVTWNPLVSAILEYPAATKLFDSADIPGEIIDLMVVNTETLAANPDFGKALVGAWYETMALMSADTPEGVAARPPWPRPPAPTSPGTTPSSPRPRCSTTPPPPWPSPKARRSARPWSMSPSSSSRRASSARARLRPISSAWPIPTARSPATRTT